MAGGPLRKLGPNVALVGNVVPGVLLAGAWLVTCSV